MPKLSENDQIWNKSRHTSTRFIESMSQVWKKKKKKKKHKSENRKSIKTPVNIWQKKTRLLQTSPVSCQAFTKKSACFSSSAICRSAMKRSSRSWASCLASQKKSSSWAINNLFFVLKLRKEKNLSGLWQHPKRMFIFVYVMGRWWAKNLCAAGALISQQGLLLLDLRSQVTIHLSLTFDFPKKNGWFEKSDLWQSPFWCTPDAQERLSLGFQAILDKARVYLSRKRAIQNGDPWHDMLLGVPAGFADGSHWHASCPRPTIHRLDSNQGQDHSRSWSPRNEHVWSQKPSWIVKNINQLAEMINTLFSKHHQNRMNRSSKMTFKGHFDQPMWLKQLFSEPLDGVLFVVFGEPFDAITQLLLQHFGMCLLCKKIYVIM